jgi:hypothetical protein
MDVRKGATRKEVQRAMLKRDESTESNAQPLEWLERKERIDRKSRLLEQLDLKREVELEGTFTKHVADAIHASGPTERQQAVDKGTEAYEDALDGALYEVLDKRFAEGARA